MRKDNPSRVEKQLYLGQAATDDDNEPAELTMVWYIGATTVCELAPVDSNGLQECSVTLEEGMTSIVAEVRDPSNEAGRFERPSLSMSIHRRRHRLRIRQQAVSFMPIKPSRLKVSFPMRKTTRRT